MRAAAETATFATRRSAAVQAAVHPALSNRGRETAAPSTLDDEHMSLLRSYAAEQQSGGAGLRKAGKCLRDLPAYVQEHVPAA